MTKLSDMDLLAAAAGQPTSRALTPDDLKVLARYKKMCRELLFNPPCECNICLRQYRTKDDQGYIMWHYLKHTNDPASLAQSYVKSIREDREFLYQKILTSGTALLKRWRRTGEAKRKEYLTTAQPDIYPFSQPLIEIASRVKMLEEARRYKAAFLLPYINIEDLSKDSANLIRLLHHRTTFPPQSWVHFDNAQLQPGWKQGGPGERSAEGCIIMHGEQYGTWKKFDRLAVHHGDTYGAIRGLVILEAQQILMSFLRNILTTILKDASTSNPQERQAETSSENLASFTFPHYDLTLCSKWIGFIEAEPHRDRPWLSVASVYTQQPYSSPACFDIDTMIEIAETKAMEAADELWLLQTDLDYFHDLMKRHEREWLDSVPGVEELKKFSPKDKMDNIVYIMTVKVAIQARDWQWLLEECQAVKRHIGEPKAKARAGELLPLAYERALCGLQYLLHKAQSWYQASLSKLFLKSQAFKSVMKVTAIGKDHRDSWALGFNLKDYSQLYRKDRIGWCLYNLTKDPEDIYTFERSVVMQHLEKFLETCPGPETGRIDQEMYKCISDMAAVKRMLSILELHRPSFAFPNTADAETMLSVLKSHPLGSDMAPIEAMLKIPELYPPDTIIFARNNPFHQTSQAWAVHSSLLAKPSNLSCANLDLGSALESSASFCMPMGRRDEQWLTQRDCAQQNLSNLWEKARHAYQMTLKASEVPQALIEPQLATMKQADSAENKAQLDLERQQILGRLQIARQRALTKSVIPPKDTTCGFAGQHDQPAYRIPYPAKEKTKTRPDLAPTSASPHAKYAAIFANLVIDEEIKEAEKPPPVLYTLKRNSVAFQVVSLMFPDRSQGIEEGAKSADWLGFVSTMDTLGFRAEHGGGSGFTFRGEIVLSTSPSKREKRSIGIHRPHPSTEMGLVQLQKLGRRCNRRFGWQRASFAPTDGGIAEDV
ncbi:MAG: hypothetical protein ASARMPREDX12_009578 [Alectoria sarmentosa]|nr:MAG: hypothetical protein ASARMPREDX12_009578 [Alectoria sarmentosa]